MREQIVVDGLHKLRNPMSKRSGTLWVSEAEPYE